VTWTAADQAERDVLLWALADGYDEHRQKCRACQPCPELASWRAHKTECRACQGEAPLTYGPPCERRRQFLEHDTSRCSCLPCPHLQAAVREVVDWREARALLSRAQALRAELEAAA
jgi:hypothetical protein